MACQCLPELAVIVALSVQQFLVAGKHYALPGGAGLVQAGDDLTQFDDLQLQSERYCSMVKVLVFMVDSSFWIVGNCGKVFLVCSNLIIRRRPVEF